VNSRTKYNLGGDFFDNTGEAAYGELFKRLKERIGGQIREVFNRERHKPPKKRRLITFVSDGHGATKPAFNRYFWRIAKLEHGVPIKRRRHGLKHNNNPIERHNQDIKQRYKVMRHFKSFDSARAFLGLRRVIFNFVRTHQGLKRTPAEAAGIDLGLGKNRLLDLIRLCSAPP
jgi:transposase-like protein